MHTTWRTTPEGTEGGTGRAIGGRILTEGLSDANRKYFPLDAGGEGRRERLITT